MRRIFKYEVSREYTPGKQLGSTIQVPKGSVFLSIQTQYTEEHESVQTWWIVPDNEQALVSRTIVLICTGETFSASELSNYIGTVQLAKGQLVFHAFFAK